MIAHCLNDKVDLSKYPYAEPTEFDEEELEDLANFGPDEIWYWYVANQLEGSGYLLMRIGNTYGLKMLSNCSCNGPLDWLFESGNWTGRIVQRGPFGDSLDSLAARCSDEMAERHAGLLFDAARRDSCDAC